MLRCSGCQHDKPTIDFYPERSRKPRGYSVWCKDCCLRRERKRNGTDPNKPKRPRKGKGKFSRAEYRKQNKDYYTAKSAERRTKKQSFPLSKENRAQIREFYRQAREQKLVVDHIHPVTHPLLCGLHVPWNLQLLTHEENSKKSNKVPEELMF